MKLKGIEITPGMVVITKTGSKYIVAPIEIPGYHFGFFSIYGGWTTSLDEDTICEIKSPPRSRITDSGKTLWKRFCELSMHEIAKKFGIPVEHLRIKK